MDDAAKKIAEGILAAIKAESDGYHFYKMAARSTQDEKGAEVFEQLALEELDHKKFLSAQYKSFVATGAPDPNVKLSARAKLADQSPIFSPAIKNRISDAHFEMSALSIGMQLEQSSQAYYRQQAEAAQNDEVKKFFTELADWEAGHYDALSRQQEELKEDFWSAAGFAPF